MFKLIGGAIILWGIADFGLSWTGTDLWGEIGVSVPDAIYPYTHYIAFGIGAVLFNLGGGDNEVEGGGGDE